MDAYDPGLAPPPFGLHNTGAICYLNSFLQMLAGCTAFTRAVLQNADYAARTRTGAAMLEFVRAYAGGAPGVTPDVSAGASAGVTPGAAPAPGVEHLSARVLQGLALDLRERRPHVQFGGGQESASEAFVHILDMMEPPALAPGGAPGGAADSPITRLFLHRFRCDLHCSACRRPVSSEPDHAVIVNLFHLDGLPAPPATAAEFSEAVRLQVSETQGYKCPACGETTKAYRVYSLVMAPEILVCAFNLYVGYGGARLPRYFPDGLELPAAGGGALAFRLVGQVEHAGGLAGGHYWARGLRAGGAVCLLNDSGVAPGAFGPAPGTYMLAYHYAGRAPPPEK